MLKKPYPKKLTCLFMMLSFLLFNFNISVFAADANAPEIAVSSTTVGKNNSLDVTISNFSSNATDWVGLYNESDTPGNVDSIWWKYLIKDLNITNGNGTFTLDLSTVSGLEEGKTYKLVLFKNDSYNVETSVTFSTSSITMSSSSLGIKDTADVTITNFSSNEKDWIGLYNENDTPGSTTDGGVASIKWNYLKDLNITNGNGTFKLDLSTISGLKQGNSYKLVLFKNDSYKVETSVKFSITAAAATSSLKSEQLKTKAGTEPQLPETVTMNNIDGTSSQVSVVWDAVSSSQYASAGSFTVEGTVQGTSQKAKADVTVVEGDGPLYSFQVISDTHIQSDLSCAYDVNFANALKDINNVEPGSSRLIINGDVTNAGIRANWEAYNKIISNNTHPKIDCSFGNHDTWQEHSWVDQDAYNTSKQNFLNYTGESNVYYDYWLNDNHFIFLGSEKSNGNYAYFSNTQLKWFEETLQKNAASNKPIFVFIHQPLYDTVSGSKPGQEWNGIEQDSAVRAILAKYPQSILFTGHTHWEFGSKYIMYNQKICSMFNIPSCGYCWTDSDTEDDISEGYYLDVYKDKVVVKGRNFTTNEWMQNAQYQISYSGNDKNAIINAVDKLASLQSTSAQLNKLTLTADKTTMTVNSGETAKLTCSASLTDGKAADMSKATVDYSSSDSSVVTVDSSGTVTTKGVGTANVIARVTLNGITETVVQQFTVEKIKTDATLVQITVDGKNVDNFAPDTLEYNVMLSKDIIKVPTVSITANDSDAKVVITQASGLTGTAVITVTSVDGTVQKIYKVKFNLSDSIIKTVETPVLSLDSSTAYKSEQKLSISCVTDGAIIRYTTDGTDPTVNSKVYFGPISLSSNTNVRAIAMKDGYNNSEITSGTYSFDIASGNEIIQNGDFSNGNTGWITYNEADSSPSGVADGQFKTSVGKVGNYSYSIELGSSNFKLTSGKKYRVSFDAKSTAKRSVEAVIEHNDTGYTRYFDQINAISTEMKTYTYDFTMSDDDDIAHLVFCMGKFGDTTSLGAHDIYIDNVSVREVTEAVANPSFSVTGGTYSSAQSVTINCATSGATIRYTTDGTDPTASSPAYSGPINVSSNTVVKAYAVKSGMPDSNISGVTYKFAKTAVPAFSIVSGTYTSAQTVTITSATEGAIIRYTTDGTTPNEKSAVYSEPIKVAANTTIKAYASKQYHTDSEISSASYIINIASHTDTSSNNTSGNTSGTGSSTSSSSAAVISDTNTDVTQNPVVSKDIFNAIKGQDKTISFNSNGTIWTFNGKDIKSDVISDIDLSLKTVSEELINKEAAKVKAMLGKTVPMFSFSFNYEGKLPGKATVKIFAGTAWANKNITIFRYYSDKNTYETIQNVQVDSNGYFTFTTDHCSDYFIVGNSNISNLPQTGSAVNLEVLLELGVMLLIIGIALIHANRRIEQQ